MICAIHQPNFFPWLGFFDKLRRCDRFVILDDAQFPKTGGSWCNRVALNMNGRRAWLTAPVVRPHGVWEIRAARFRDGPWREQAVKTVQAAYGSSPHFKEYADAVREWLLCPENQLCEYNLNAIRGLGRVYGLDYEGKAVRASSLNVPGAATERLVRLTQAAGCSVYMCGGGAAGYQEEELFARAGLSLVRQNFAPPEYSQPRTPEFIPGLSILDYLFNCGNKPW